MTLRGRYRKLTLWNKIALWGAIASLVGFGQDFVRELVASSDNQQNLPVEVGANDSVDINNYHQRLLACGQELRSNHEFMWRLRRYVHVGEAPYPTGAIRVDTTLKFFDEDYQRIADPAFGEEKNLYQLVLRLQSIGESIKSLKDRIAIQRWNEQAEMTLDDISFLCGFLYWYIAIFADYELPGRLAISIHHNYLTNRFANSDDVDSLTMKYFTEEDGSPILKYDEYLGLID